MTLDPEEGSGRAASLLRWGGAGLLIAAAHVGAGWWVLTHPIGQAAPSDTVQGIPIDLEPVAVSQNAPEPNTTTSSGEMAPAQDAAVPDPEPAPASPPEPAITPPPPEPPPPELAPPEPPPPPQAIEPSPPVMEPSPPEPTPAPAVQQPPPAPEPPVTLPEQDTKSDAVLAPPPKSRPVPPKPDPRQLARDAARKKDIAERREQQRAERAQARARARAAQARQAAGRAPENAAPSSASSGASVSTWRGEVLAHLNAFKPAPPNGATGTARIAFSVDRTGRVLSASLVGSSGDAALDAAALSMVRRASPVPAPPPELGGRIPLTVPVYFH